MAVPRRIAAAILGVALLGGTLATSADASAATAAHNGRIVVKVTWSGRHHATEIVRVKSDPRNRRVQAIGICDSTGYWVFGRILHGRGVSRIHCRGAEWETAGDLTGWAQGSRYHSARGLKQLV